jgi:hypothetical protein
MNNYFVVYRVPVATAEEWQKTTPPEEIKKQMDTMMADMMAWTEKHKASLVGEGLPLGKTKRVTKDGVEDTKNDLNYYCIVQADSHEDAAKLFTDSPHLTIPTAFIEVMEIPHMGM